MKDYQGFKNNGNWYKGNLHSHTTVSDGKMTPEQSVEVYKEHGYNFRVYRKFGGFLFGK